MTQNELRRNGVEQSRKEAEVFQSLYHLAGGRIVVLRDGRVAGSSQPEPQFMQHRYQHAQALRDLKRESRMREVLGDESRGFVDRIRVALGIA